VVRLVLTQAVDRAKAGTAWKENNLVFCTSPGRPYAQGGPMPRRPYARDMSATDGPMEFKQITGQAGPGRDWTPRELRHTFVLLLSDSGVPIEQIADAVGTPALGQPRLCTCTQLRPVTRTAAVALGPLFESRETTNGGQS
jgi:hypothetical protein